jgi:hypothetical protein
VAATLTALIEHHGLGSSGQPERLLFGGCSAGGRGVLTNLDYFAQAAPPSVTVSGLLDAAGWVDVEPIIPNMLSLQMMTQDLFGFTNPVIPATCAAQYTGSDAWKCLWPSYRLPFVTTPYFLNAAQFDGNLLLRLLHARRGCALTPLLPRSLPNHVRLQQPGQHVLLHHAG